MSNVKKKKLRFFVKIFFCCIFFTFGLSNSVISFELTYPKGPNAGIEFLSYLYNFGILLLGVIFLGVLIYEGIKLISSQDPTEVENAKVRIRGAFLGVLIVLSSYIILRMLYGQGGVKIPITPLRPPASKKIDLFERNELLAICSKNCDIEDENCVEQNCEMLTEETFKKYLGKKIGQDFYLLDYSRGGRYVLFFSIDIKNFPHDQNVVHNYKCGVWYNGEVFYNKSFELRKSGYLGSDTSQMKSILIGKLGIPEGYFQVIFCKHAHCECPTGTTPETTGTSQPTPNPTPESVLSIECPEEVIYTPVTVEVKAGGGVDRMYIESESQIPFKDEVRSLHIESGYGIVLLSDKENFEGNCFYLEAGRGGGKPVLGAQFGTSSSTSILPSAVVKSFLLIPK